MLRRIALLTLLPALLACHRAPTLLHGYTYDFITTATGGGERAAHEIRGHVASTGDMRRIQFDDGEPSVVPPHTAIVTRDNGKTVDILDLDAHRYSTMSSHEFAEATRQKMQGHLGKLSMDVAGVTARVEDVSSGENIDGHPTTCTTLRINFDAMLAFAATRRSFPSHLRLRVWSTDDVPSRYAPSLGDDEVESGFEAIDVPLRKLLKEISGFPLREEVRTDIEVTEALTQRMKNETTVSHLTETTIDSSQFEVPDGFKKVASTLRGE